jgi:glycerate kinase
LYSGAVRVLVTPDKFKGTLTAVQAAEAIARGWVRAVPNAEVEQIPMADGGEGTLDALVASLGGWRHRARATGPLGDLVDAEYAMAVSQGESIGVVEMARASGLALISESRRNPTRTTTRGTGELILEACHRGARRVLVCIGGSATNDAGAGMAQAVGIRLLDGSGRDLRPGGSALLDLARIDMSGLDPTVAAATFIVATDVDNPLLGPQGASAVYGPQKGASPDDVALLDRALGHFAAMVYRDLGADVRNFPGAGAAGGMGAGLIAFVGARLRPGVDVVMESLRLPQRLESADLVVTGEGRFDQQSLRGKVPAGVLRVAAEARVRALVLCGQADVELPGVKVFSLAERFGEKAAMERAGPLLGDLAAEVAARVDREGKDGRPEEGQRGRGD